MGSLTKLATEEVWAQAGSTPMRHAIAAATPWHIDRDAHGRIEVCDVGRVRLARIRANPLCVEHGSPMSAVNDANLFRVLLQVSGRSVLRQAGREVLLSAGDWTLYEGARSFELSNLERCEQRMVILPRAELWGGTLDLDALTVRRFGSHDRTSRQLLHVLDSAFELASEYGVEAAVELAAVAVHLSRLALIENAAAALRPHHSELMRQRVTDYMERNLRDPALSVASIAAALNCSKRYLHKVFADRHETIAECILNARLEKCYAALDRADLRGNSIAEVAYSFGFKSLSHFGKAFGKRYGMTPTERRRLARTSYS